MAVAVVGAIVLLVALVGGCGSDQVCGPGDAPADGIEASVGGETLSYGAFTSSPNNDCTPPDGEVTSITLDGDQLAPAPTIPLGITFCLPRPDAIGAEPIAIGDPERLQLIDVFAELSDGCLVMLDRGGQVSGTATFEGYCDDGSNPGGYAMALDGTIPVTRMCDGQADTLTVSGRVAVETLVF